MVDDIKIFVVARDDARMIMDNKEDKQYRFLVERCQKEIETEPFIKA